MTPWWTDTFFGVWLGLGHAAVAIGVAGWSAWLMWRGVGRTVVKRALLAMMSFGAVALVLGLFALLSGQPFRVWYPLTMMGGVSMAVWLPNLFAIEWFYRRGDARRLAAEELRRS